MLCKWKKYDKTSSEIFTAWVSDPVKFPEKGLSTMAAIWPSTERVKGSWVQVPVIPDHFISPHVPPQCSLTGLSKAEWCEDSRTPWDHWKVAGDLPSPGLAILAGQSWNHGASMEPIFCDPNKRVKYNLTDPTLSNPLTNLCKSDLW
jgi:hypothetical protein